MPRDDFPKEAIDILARRVNYRCSMPSCRVGTSGPRSDSARSVNIGVAAHITAAAPGGPRYDSTLTSEARRSVENGVWLCGNHAKLVDNDASRYTVEQLRDWKRTAEAEALAEIEGVARVIVHGTAALQFLVGGKVMAPGVLPQPFSRGYDETDTCNRHEYEFCVLVRNSGKERLRDWHVDLEFPALVIEAATSHHAYVPDRSTRDLCFFRASGSMAPELFPGDSHRALELRFNMNEDIFWRRSHVLDARVRAVLHLSGRPPVTVDQAFRLLQNY